MYNVIGLVILTFDRIFRSIIFLSYRADPITSRSIGVIPNPIYQHSNPNPNHKPNLPNRPNCRNPNLTLTHY